MTTSIDVADAMPPAVGETLCLPCIDVRDRALPIRPGDLTRLLMAQPELSDDDREMLGKFGPLLGAVFHSEFYERLRELKELYAPLDPDSDYVDLDRPLHRPDRGLRRGVPPARSRPRWSGPTTGSSTSRSSSRPSRPPTRSGLTYVPNFDQFEHLRIYARGYTQIARVFRSRQDQVPQADHAPGRLPAAGDRA